MRACCLVIVLAALLCGSASARVLRAYMPVEYDDATQYLPNKAADGVEAARNRFAQAGLGVGGDAPAAADASGSAGGSDGGCSREVHDCDSPKEKEEDASRNSHLSGDMDETRDQELADAMQSIKDQIVQKATQIKAEKKWVKEVTSLVEEYVHKIRKVNANIRLMQKEVKDLFRKKKQIENLILQRKLERKLRIANADLNTLKKALENVRDKETKFVKSKRDIRETIGAIEEQLNKLAGKEPAKQ